MNAIKVLDELRRRAVFDLSTFASIIGKQDGYARLYLHRMKKRGLVTRIQRNAYTVHANALVVASRITWPSYISLWSALRYHDLTEQVPHAITVITTRRKNRRTIRLGDTDIVFEVVDPAHFFGFKKESIEGTEVFMAEPEKALLDCVLLRRVSVSEVFEMMRENARRLDMEKLVAYVVRTRRMALAKRVGWLLERVGHDGYGELRSMIYHNYIPLDYSRPARGAKNRKWFVIENVDVVR
jgi:predicted transcriptional regulator of viral defense system